MASPGAANQTFADPARPHAISRREDTGVDYAYDADGNLASAVGPAASRLACVGTTAGGCETLAVAYDADGVRTRETFTAAGDPDPSHRVFLDDWATLVLERYGASNAETYADAHIRAFGGEIARRRV